ncbi:tetratricopeptide repeat protein [Actinoplanes sp. NPDC049118]|uniref:tetratricopeptide repeat protein n=1 Tax=Actinoplanes sp. NPDC049118 TaxID=3155769 RepID=UPI003405274F
MTGDDAHRRAWHLAEAGRHAEAEKVLRAALTAEPADARLLTMLGYVLRRQFDYVSALAACDAAIAALPGLADAHGERAETLLCLLRDRDAVASATEAVRLAPHNAASHLVLARTLAQERRFDEARAAADRGRALAPQFVDGLLAVADVNRVAGKRDVAEEAARAALALDPDNEYGRWLLAMIDAERLRVGRSMRALRDVASENPARPDVVSMTWPIRGLLGSLRIWFPVAIALVAAVTLAGVWWPPAATIGRILAALFAAVVAGFALRLLVPAGRLPWRCLRLSPALLRRAAHGGTVTVCAQVALLIAYAVTGLWWLPVLALAAAPVQWGFGLAELIGARMDDPGYLHALKDLGRDFRDWGAEFGQWWRETKRELRETWHDDNQGSVPPRSGRTPR